MFVLNKDGIVVLDKKYKDLWNIFHRTNGRSYKHIITPYNYETKIPSPIRVSPGVLTELPENFQATLEFGQETIVSIYRVNLVENRMDICVSENSDFLYKLKVKTVTLNIDASIIYIEGSSKADITFSIPKARNFPFDGHTDKNIKGKCLLGKPVLCVSRLTRNIFYDTPMPEFAAVQYYINRSLIITSMPIPMSLESNVSISCSGNMEFNTSNLTLLSLTKGIYKTAKGIDGKLIGLLLPNRSCVIDFDVRIEVEGKTPEFTAYLLCKTAPDSYIVHNDETGKECQSVVTLDNGDYHSKSWKLPVLYNSNVILCIEISNYSPDESNIDTAEYTININ